jgi:hypothetical protein
LKLEHATKRLRFAHLWRDFDWSNAWFGDEMSYEKGRGKGPVWVFRRSNEGYDRDKVREQEPGKGMRQMVWAAIRCNDATELIKMERDPEAPRNGYTAHSYQNALEDGLRHLYEPGAVYVQDNSPLHSAKTTREWFGQHGIWVVELPPFSPDLNPIENIWAQLKKLALERHPEIVDLTASELGMQRMWEMLVESWDDMPRRWIEACTSSMNDRLEAVIAADGWYTKY